MRVVTGAVYGTVALVLVATFLSGPLVGAVDFTPARPGPGSIGQGNLTVSEVSLPANATLDQGFRSQNYYLKVPDATMVIENVSGRPIAEYEIDIPGLHFSRGTTTFLDGDMSGATALSLSQTSFGPGEISRSEYAATLSLVVRYNGTERVLATRRITVEVTG